MKLKTNSKLPVRKPTQRLPGYDYSKSNYYFVTLCTKDKKEWFGAVMNNQMVLDEIGKIIKQQWIWLADQYPYVVPDQYVIMPNHLHGIVVINQQKKGHSTGKIANSLKDKLQFLKEISRPVANNDMKIKSLSSLIGAFKTTSSKLIHHKGFKEFAWQRSFYDHIIRSDGALDNIREYIINNPLNWANDEENLNMRVKRNPNP